MRPLRVVLFVVAVLATACGGGQSDSASPSAVATTDSDAAPEPAVDEPTVVPVPTEPTVPAATTAPTPDPQQTATLEPEPTLTIQATGLNLLAGDAVYETWLVVNDDLISVGTTPDLSQPIVFPVGDAEDATAVVVTVETDNDPAPSSSRVLAGDLNDSGAHLTVIDAQAVGVEFDGATGQYILATPTDGTGAPENERSGVWWTFIPRAQSLVLPPLGDGWVYEGWQIIDGVAVTTGTFVSQFGEPDLAAPFSGPQPGPPFPGEDFLLNAPDGVAFPHDLRGTEVVITVEPMPDTGPEPFSLIPLRGTVPSDAVDHVSYAVDNVADELPTGTATLG
jgi:hypothetical protein